MALKSSGLLFAALGTHMLCSGGGMCCRWHGCLSFTTRSNCLLHLVQHNHAAWHSQTRNNVRTISSPHLWQFYIQSWWKGM